LICGFSSLLCLIVLFDVLEIVVQNLVLIVLVFLVVINISVGLGFFVLSNYSSNFDEIVSVFVSSFFETYPQRKCEYQVENLEWDCFCVCFYFEQCLRLCVWHFYCTGLFNSLFYRG
jgi:hypothetical protein